MLDNADESIELWMYGSFKIFLIKDGESNYWSYEIQHPIESICPLSFSEPKHKALARAILEIEKELRFIKRQAEEVIARVEEDFSKLRLEEFPEEVRLEVIRVRMVRAKQVD